MSKKKSERSAPKNLSKPLGGSNATSLRDAIAVAYANEAKKQTAEANSSAIDKNVPIARSSGLPTLSLPAFDPDLLPVGALKAIVNAQSENIEFLRKNILELQVKQSIIGDTVFLIIGKLIETLDHKFPSDLIEKKVAELTAYSAGKSADEVLRYALRLLESLPQETASTIDQLPDLPTMAPENWKGGRGKTTDPSGNPEDPVMFIRRVYGPWLGRGLTRGDIRELDPPLAQSLYHHIRQHGMPQDLNLPSKVEENTRWIERVKQGGLADLPHAQSPDGLREAERFLTMAKRREQRAGKKENKARES